MKTLVLSDIHYPAGISEACFDVICKERPDLVVLLGDIVVGRGELAVRNMKKFLEHYPHPHHRSVFIVGDNEFRGSREVLKIVAALPKLNSNPFRHFFGNMFFAHGNVEGYGPLSGLLERLGVLVARAAKPVVPRVVAKLARVENGLDHSVYAFLGHIHYLGQIEEERTTFCGTFSTRRIVFGPEESLGYVVLEHSEKGFLEPGGIRVVRLG